METNYKVGNTSIKLWKTEAFYHVLFWVVFINYYGLIDNAYAIKYNINWLGYALGVVLFYVISLWIMPRFYEKKYYIISIFSFLILFFIYNLLMLLILYAQTKDENFWLFINSEANDLSKSIIKNLNNFITYGSYGIVFWTFGFIKKQYKEKERIENKKFTIEKDFLNSQINQHFLYNMLNLFYVKANQYSEHLAYDILTFSELLRYSLKDDNKEFVAIEDEIEVVKKMIYLFNNRLDSHTTGRLDIGDIPSDFKIPSSMLVLIYQSLLTNADKVKIDFHVFINYADEKLQIKVNYTSKLSNKKISFTILKERLNFIYNTNYFFHETQSDSHSELIIVLPHRN